MMADPYYWSSAYAASGPPAHVSFADVLAALVAPIVLFLLVLAVVAWWSSPRNRHGGCPDDGAALGRRDRRLLERLDAELTEEDPVLARMLTTMCPDAASIESRPPRHRWHRTRG